MEELDTALNELGMLSSCSKYKLDYLKAMETASEVRRARSGSVPGTRDTSDHEVSISLNSAFVTNIALCPRTRTPPDLSPFMRRRLQLEAEERRLAPQGEAGGHSCDRHSCHSSHICSFVSPRRNRSLRNSPYNLGTSFQSSLASFSLVRPSVSPLSGVLISSRNKSLGRLRGPVRFHDPGVSQQASLYPLDDDITSKLSSIQLSSSDSKVSSQPPEVSPVSVTSDLAKLVIGRSAN